MKYATWYIHRPGCGQLLRIFFFVFMYMLSQFVPPFLARRHPRVSSAVFLTMKTSSRETVSTYWKLLN